MLRSRSGESPFPSSDEALCNTLQIPRQCCMSSLVLASLKKRRGLDKYQKNIKKPTPSKISPQRTWLAIFISNRDSFTSAAQTGKSFQCGLDDMEGAPEAWTSSALAWINSPRNHSITSIVALVSSRFPFPCWHAPSHPSLVWQRHRKYWHSLAQTVENVG